MAGKLKKIQETKEEFWDRWMKEEFLALLKQMKWFKYKWNVQLECDILRRYERAAEQTFALSRCTIVQTERLDLQTNTSSLGR
jgi:hypothetical protein